MSNRPEGCLALAVCSWPLAMGMCLLLYGCAATPDSGPNAPPTATATRSPAAVAAAPPPTIALHDLEPASTLIDARPLALVNGRPLTWGDLRPSLTDMAGAEALHEVILDRRLNETLASAGIEITGDDVAAERRLLLESLSDDPNHAIRLLEELRERQRLGRVRFEALMRRNAGLRAMVRDRVQVNDEAVRNMHEHVHGPKRQARLMVLPNLESAQAAINLVNGGISFADVALERSIDTSATRGGLLEPISRVDPAYPEAVRQALWSLNPGEMSSPILLEDRYAILLLVRQIDANGTSLQSARPALERAARLQQERILMDQLALRLLSDTQVTIFDDVLNEAWKRRRRSD